ncbi:uncharacterized protein LOC114358062 [Ostrinia furnacalis]|uniref:uncharacterized protein LOC114358062 n=1 Tax=Ostrinia furnacalis TaxID=93504 RepID=UPI00103CA32D|nr:uncharacterized protein LOC114358062 [Ostrinia furnacalis]
MRSSTRRLKTTKSTYRHKVNKRHYKSNSSLGCTQCVSILDIENINEILRVHKSQRAEGKGAWKVVPKDSCEVYKDRRKRQAENRREDDETMRTTDSDRTPSRNKKNQKRNDDKKYRKDAVRKTRRRRKTTRRREPNSSVSSFTTTTSYMSSSEMDYD